MSLLLNADFAPLVDLAAHRQALWERQRGYILERSPLLRDVWGELAWSLLAPCHFPATTSRAPSSIDAWGKRTEERSWMFVRWLI